MMVSFMEVPSDKGDGSRHLHSSLYCAFKIRDDHEAAISATVCLRLL